VDRCHAPAGAFTRRERLQLWWFWSPAAERLRAWGRALAGGTARDPDRRDVREEATTAAR
jgi:hypothetical protein